MGLLPAPGSHAGLGGVALVLAFLALFTAVAFKDTKETQGPTRLVLRGLVLAFDIIFLVAVIVNYGDAVWFPPD